MPLEFDCDRERRILGIVEQLLGGALSDRRKTAQFVYQRIGSAFEFRIGNAIGCDTPIKGLLTGDSSRTHHDVLGPGDSDHFL